MKKVICFILIVFMVSFPMMAKAVSYGYSNVTGSSFSIRTAPTTSASVIGYLYGGVNVDITETAHGNGCGTWYRVNFNNSTGWVCGITNGGSRNVELYTTNTLRTNNREPQTDYERQLSSAGFPSSYWDKLTALHNVHPNWNFVANQTGRDWAYATWAETGAVSDGDDDKSLLYAYNGDTNIIAGYLKTDNYNYKSNTFNMKDSGGFYAARQEMVAYYMDPRNFLNENFIFQFETLSYNSTYHTTDIVSNIFGGGYLNRYATNYVSAGRAKGVSPVHMATRSVQEGTNRDYFLTNGSAFTYDGSYYPSIVGHVFSNCFNFFNIGAYSDTRNAAHNAGVYACGGPNRNDLTYGRPWNTVDKALLGGAEILAGGYVSAGQDTLYFQKYNTASYTRTALYGHQYMSNIAAVAYEGSDTYDSYKDAGVINQAFTFVIPVYNNMPEKTYLPSSLSPNNYLKSLKVDGVEVPSFDGDRTSGYRIIVPNTKSSINITADPVVSGTSINLNNQKVDLSVGDNNIDVVVTALNGEQRTYTVVVTRENPVEPAENIEALINNSGYKQVESYLGNISVKTDINSVISKMKNQNDSAIIEIKDSSSKDKALNSYVATGDKITVTLNGETKTYEIFVSADVNGDGLAKANDYLMIKDSIMGKYTISGVYRKAADVNKDNDVRANDYLMIKDYIMGKLSSL